MKIGVFGTGIVGQTISEKLVQVGNDVMIGTRDKDATLTRKAKDNFGRPGFGDWIRNNPKVKVAEYPAAAEFAELIVNATNGMGSMQALEEAGEKNLKGKVIVDISNPLDFSKGMPPTLFVSNTDSLGEQIQRRFPEAKVVKTLNTMNAYVMVNPGLLSEDHTVFLSGNDAAAKSAVKQLLSSFGWKEHNMLDMGDLTSARGVEQILPLWVRLLGTLKTPMFNFKIVKSEK